MALCSSNYQGVSEGAVKRTRPCDLVHDEGYDVLKLQRIRARELKIEMLKRRQPSLGVSGTYIFEVPSIPGKAPQNTEHGGQAVAESSPVLLSDASRCYLNDQARVNVVFFLDVKFQAQRLLDCQRRGTVTQNTMNVHARHEDDNE